MNSKRFFAQIFVIMLFPLLLTVGCAQREAQKALTEAQQAQEEAQGAGAPGYVPQMYTTAQNMLSQAQSQFDNGDYELAIETANTAQSRFVNAKEQVPRVKQRVDAQLADIETALSEAEANMQQARTVAQGILTPAELESGETLVSELRNEYESTVSREVDEEQLNAFLQRAQDAVQETQSLVNAPLKPDASAAKQELEDMMEQARELKADIHAPDRFAQVQQQMTQLDALERDGKWQGMIELADQIREPLNEIITVAQEKAAGDILNDLMAQINQAKAMNVANVAEFTSNLQQSETAWSEGQTALQEENYSLAIAAAEDAKAALDRADQALGTAAQNLIQTAESNLQAALALEAERYAPQVVSQIRDAAANAQEQIAEGNNSSAYSSAQRAAQVSEGASEAARRGKAQLSLNKVEQPFSVLHSQGGSKYAPQAYQSALSAIQRLRNLMSAGDYEQVVAGESEALQTVQDSLAELAKSAARFIERADQAIEASEYANAPDVVSMMHANAVNLRSAAEKELENEKYLNAIQKAEGAIEAAKNAENRAYQLRAEQNIREGDRLISLAEQAGQKALSPLAYRNAVEAKDETQQMIARREYQDAFERSEEAKELADQALNNLVYQAQNQVDDALTAKAMTYAKPEITQALTQLKTAEEAQNEKRYSIANEKAQQAYDAASRAEHFTYQQRSYALLQKLSDLKMVLEQDLVDVYTPALYQRALNHLAEAKVEQIEENYEESFYHADAAEETARLAYQTKLDAFDKTIANLQGTANWLGEHALDESGRSIKMNLLDAITEFKRQIALENYAQAHQAEAMAIQVAEETSMQLANLNRRILTGRLKEQLAEYEKQHALAIVPEKQEFFQDTFAKLQEPVSGNQYNELKSQYDEAVETVNNLPTDIETMANQRTDEIALIFQQVDDIVQQQRELQHQAELPPINFYADWTRELRTDLQWVRNSLEGGDYAEISARLTKLEEETNELLAATELAAEEADYLRTLSRNLSQVKTITDNFGYVLEVPQKLITFSMISPVKMDPQIQEMYKQLQGDINARTMRINAELLEDRVKDLNPPETMKSVHNKALKAFALFRKAAHGFEVFGENDVYDIEYRNDAFNQSHEQLKKMLELNEELQFAIDSHRRKDTGEVVQWKMRKLERDFGKWYFDWNAE